MKRVQILFCSGTLALVASISAHAQCPASGVGTKLKLPLVRVHAPCGYKGREADTTTAWGPVCSTATSYRTECRASPGERCASNADCSETVCQTYEVSFEKTGAQCDTNMDCLPTCNSDFCHDIMCANSSSFGSGAICTSSYLDSTYEFDTGSRCVLSARSKAEKDCAAVKDKNGNSLGLDPGPCHMTYINASCSGVVRADGTPISADDETFALRLSLRFALDDGSTTLDFPFELPFSTPVEGSMSLGTTTAEALSSRFDDRELPPCTAVEIVGATIIDPLDRPFATIGLATH
jgi:hypothetical protein